MTYGDMQIGGTYIGFEVGKNTEFVFPIRDVGDAVEYIGYNCVALYWRVVQQWKRVEFGVIPFTNHTDLERAVVRLFDEGISGWPPK